MIAVPIGVRNTTTGKVQQWTLGCTVTPVDDHPARESVKRLVGLTTTTLGSVQEVNLHTQNYPEEIGTLYRVDSDLEPAREISETMDIKPPAPLSRWVRSKTSKEIIVYPLTRARATLAGNLVTGDPYGAPFTKSARNVTDVPGGVGACNRTLYNYGGNFYADIPQWNTGNNCSIEITYQWLINEQAKSLEPYRGALRDCLAQCFAHSGTSDTELVTAGVCRHKSATWDLAVEIAESRETISFIFDVMETIGKIILTRGGHIKKLALRARTVAKQLAKDPVYSRRTARTLADITSQLADAKLAFSYAVKPLMYSVEDAMAYFNNSAVFNTTRMSRSATVELATPFGTLPFKATKRYWGKSRIDSAFVNNKRGTGGINAFSAYHEIISYSFVLDWMANIGDFLGCLVDPQGVVESAHTYSTKFEYAAPVSTPDGDLQLSLEFYRTFPINPLSHIGIVVRPEMSTDRWINAAALAYQQMYRMLRKKL